MITFDLFREKIKSAEVPARIFGREPGNFVTSVRRPSQAAAVCEVWSFIIGLTGTDICKAKARIPARHKPAELQSAWITANNFAYPKPPELPLI